MLQDRRDHSKGSGTLIIPRQDCGPKKSPNDDSDLIIFCVRKNWTAQLRHPGAAGGGANGEQEGLHKCKVWEKVKEQFFAIVPCESERSL